MAIYSGMFNSVNGDRKYNAWWFALFFSRFIGDGVFPNPSTGLQVYENTNMTTVVKPGDGWIKGRFIHSDSDYVLQHDLADGVLKRIDRIVVRVDYSKRETDFVIKKGAFASQPVAPGLQRDADVWELGLADVLINNGAIQITQGNITDLRLNNNLCGIVHGVVDQADMTTIFNQYQSWFDAYSVGKKAEFEAWVETLKDILSGDVAGNLLTLINQNQSDIKSVIRIKRNNILPVDNWYEGNQVYIEVVDGDVTERDMVDVSIHKESLLPASYMLPITESYNGGFKMYSNKKPTEDITFDYRISREVL